MCMCVEVSAKSTESNEGNNKHEINDFTIVVLMDIEENLKKKLSFCCKCYTQNHNFEYDNSK